jgi:CheY-like chemotaxis protein
MKLGAIAAKVCENLGSRALSLEREWLSPSGWPFLFCRHEGPYMNAQLPSRVRLGNFRSALVIEKEDALRSSIVRFLKHQGWLVHGLRRAEQAFPIFAHVLYDLVLIDVELPGITGLDFVRILHNSREWRTIPLVVISASECPTIVTEILNSGAFLARKSVWKDDLSTYFLSLH